MQVHQNAAGPGAPLLLGEAERAGTAQSGKKEAQGGSHQCLYLKERCQEDGTMLLSVVPSARTRDNGHKLEHRGFL